MPDDRKSLPEEVAELTEAVRELRDREVADEIHQLRDEIAALRAEKNGHTCHGHGCCGHWHYYYTPTWIGGAGYPVYYTVTNATATAGPNVCGGGNTLTLSGYQPSAAAGAAAGYTSTYTVSLGTS